MPIVEPYTPVEPITETWQVADVATHLSVSGDIIFGDYTLAKSIDGTLHVLNGGGRVIGRLVPGTIGYVYQERVVLDANGIRVVT